MAYRQDNKCEAEANTPTLSSESLNMVQIENRPRKHTLQALHMLSSTLSNPISIFAWLTIPSESASSKQMESLGQMGGKQITAVRVRGDSMHLNRQSCAHRSAEEAVRFHRRVGFLFYCTCSHNDLHNACIQNEHVVGFQTQTWHRASMIKI